MTFTARNKKTGATKVIKVSEKSLEKIVCDSVDKCCGPCRCTVEPDCEECSAGWPSRLIAAGLI